VPETDIIVIGGGAAGLFCAIEAGKRGRKVIVLEHADRVGKKIAISGGGRCNFTNLNTAPDNFISANPHFCKSALARYTPSDFVSLVEKHGIAYHEKKSGQLFCDGSSQNIIAMLLAEASEAGVQVHCGAHVRSVTQLASATATAPQSSPPNHRFAVSTGSTTFNSESLVIATGGLSIAPLGASDFGYQLARQFGIRIREPWPALVPFTLARETLRELMPLSGISIDAEVKCQGRRFRESILFTHRGLSGPGILQISTYWRPGLSIAIDLLPDRDALELLQLPEYQEVTLANVLSQLLPRRFAQAWCALNFPSQALKRYPRAQLMRIAQRLNNWEVAPAGTEGYRKAEVTAGGIATEELSSQTMAAHKVPGLYFIGEVVDVTGHLGGYNFQWAWSSGYAAGQSA
jgi:predicted Rossmann fold flavoprotein